MSEEVADRFR